MCRYFFAVDQSVQKKYMMTLASKYIFEADFSFELISTELRAALFKNFYRLLTNEFYADAAHGQET
jgi:hypothetical protein